MRFSYIGVVSTAMTLLIEITFHLLCQGVKGLVVSRASAGGITQRIKLCCSSRERKGVRDDLKSSFEPVQPSAGEK